jgi:hypothetical protein
MADDIDFHTAIVTFKILSYDASELQCSCNNSECLLDIRQTLIVTMQHRYSLYVVPPYLPDALRTVLVVPAQGPSGATILSNDAGVELLPRSDIRSSRICSKTAQIALTIFRKFCFIMYILHY